MLRNFHHLFDLYPYPSLKFTSNFRPDYVRSRWEELLRVAATLKSGWVTSSLLTSKLQGYPRQHHLTALLQEYGKLTKTTFILRYLQSQPLRRRIHAQLKANSCMHLAHGYGLMVTDIFGANRKRFSKKQLVV
jgi:TnpA family transposase